MAGVYGETAGPHYAAFIADQLAEERKRKDSFEQRGVTVVTTTGVIVSLLFGLAAFVGGGSPRQIPSIAAVLLVMALPFLLSAAACGIAVNFPRGYEEPVADGLTRLTTVELWSAPPLHATRRLAHSHARSLANARVTNSQKGRLLLAALVAEVAGVVFAASAVGAVLLEPYVSHVDAVHTLLIVGLASTLLGALVLAWHDLRGGFRGDEKVTLGAIEKGIPRTGAARLGFPLIAFGTILQIIAIALD